MRRGSLIAVLMMLLCLLSACGGKEKKELQASVDFRTELLRAGGCRFRLDGRTEVEDRIYEYSLLCRCGTDGASEVEVLAPEPIAGIRVRTAPGEAKLLYDGAELTFGEPEEPRLAPAAAAATLVSAWTEANITDVGREDGALQMCCRFGYDEDGLLVYTTFDEKGKPASAELVCSSRTVTVLTISDFEFTTGGNDEITQEDMG